MNEKRAFAKNLRENPTPAEATLWEYLRKEQLGYRFWRQQLLQGYVVDFYCPRARLVVEVDGSVHELKDQAFMDECRGRALGEKGISLCRVGNQDVFAAPQLVLRRIRHACESRIAPFKAVHFNLKQDSSLASSSSRWLCQSGKRHACSSGMSDLSPSTFEEISPSDLRRAQEKLVEFARQKRFPFPEPDTRPAVEKVYDQRVRLEEWVKKKA